MPGLDRAVAIAGATGSAGRAAAAAFATTGAKLGLIGTNRERPDATAAELGLADDAWAPGVGDVRQPLRPMTKVHSPRRPIPVR
jgi:NADP-dependent 3-hydroxy acid dehydrogenase YdfG